MMFDKVEKFELGKEEYSKRTDTVQVFLSRYPPHGDKLSFHCAQSPHNFVGIPEKEQVGQVQ